MLELTLVESIADLGSDCWAELEGPESYPFLSYEFLSALEETGCLGADRGWIPRHIVIRNGSEIWAVAPAYIKLHSFGEFVFDQSWAEFSERRLGLRYYPKLVICAPFTPATGPRILLRRGMDREDRSRVAVAFREGVPRVTASAGLSSAHVLFVDEAGVDELKGTQWAERLGVQLQFQSGNYADFDEFLGSVSAKKRAQIRRERRAIEQEGVTISVDTGSGIRSSDADLAYRLYLSTVDKFVWGRRYLTPSFFERVMCTMPSQIHFVLARDHQGEVLGGAFNLLGRDALYGRYWGSFRDVPFLHFNVCLYKGIEECLSRGLSRFEPGAGGAHKQGRGFLPTLTRSLHHIQDPGLELAIRDFCEREAEALREEIGGSEPSIGG